MSSNNAQFLSARVSKNAVVSSPRATNAVTAEKLIAQAHAASDPSLNAGVLLETFGDPTFGGSLDAAALAISLKDRGEEIAHGNMAASEAMLFGQANALQAIFVKYARLASQQDGLKRLEVVMGIALKAQAQCRATLQALTDLKFPKSATFIRQANVSNQQQVINGNVAREAKPANSANEVLPTEKGHHAKLEQGREKAAVSIDPKLEPVDAVHRAEDRGGKGPLQPKRVKARDALRGMGRRDAAGERATEAGTGQRSKPRTVLRSRS